MKKDVEHYN